VEDLRHDVIGLRKINLPTRPTPMPPLIASTHPQGAWPAARGALAQWVLRREREYDHHTLRVLLLAWVGVVGMPLYYVLWTRFFPQPYDSVPLRALGTLLCGSVILALPHLARRWQRLHGFVTITYCLPFLFTYIYLMNRGTAVWTQSLLVGLIILFHFPLRWALCSGALGVGAGVLLFALHGDLTFLLSQSVREQLPICVFTAFVVCLAKLGRRVMQNEKLAGMAHGLASVSHELRTPLVSVDANVRGINRMRARGQDDGAALAEALGRIQFEVRHMNHMIDLFLLSATVVHQKLEPTEHLSMKGVVENVLRRYPFTSAQQRANVTVEVRADFTFAGQHDLSVVVLLNLLRNALKALHRAGKGRVRIIVDGSHPAPRLLFIDTGCGIAPAQLPKIFKRFYSHPSSAGAGIGLALCRDILDAWQASIRCVSRELAYTMFVLEFPPVPAPAARPTSRFD
jgi:two-component system CAI-1 autoinducer sensor kinase/phosphatase CqsS